MGAWFSSVFMRAVAQVTHGPLHGPVWSCPILCAQALTQLRVAAGVCVRVCVCAVQYQTAAVHVPSYLREVAAKLYRVKQQLQRKQQGAEPSLADIAAAAGVSLKQAEQALQATNGSLQVGGMLREGQRTWQYGHNLHEEGRTQQALCTAFIPLTAGVATLM